MADRHGMVPGSYERGGFSRCLCGAEWSVWEGDCNEGGFWCTAECPEDCRTDHKGGVTDQVGEVADRLDLDALEALATAHARAYERMLEIGEGIGGLAVQHPEMFDAVLAWGEASRNGLADTVIALIRAARDRDELQARLDEVRGILNAASVPLGMPEAKGGAS